MSTLTYRLVLLLCFLSFFPCGDSASFAEPKTLSLSNEFIKINVNNTDAKGRFSLETSLGNPSNPNDDYQELIYGKPIPWTSYTTLQVNDSSYIFGNKDTRLEGRSQTSFNYLPIHSQIVTGNLVVSYAKTSSIAVTQRLSFYRNPNTNLYDSIQIEYELNNSTAVTQSIGLRIMLDTKLGANDGAPFRMGDMKIDHEIKLHQDNLYNYWQAFDSLTSPNIIAQGILRDIQGTLTPPDHIHLANWGSLADTPWNSPYNSQRSFIRAGETQKDTALALTYIPRIIPPYGSTIIRTVYGLGGISLSAGELSLGMSAPKSLPRLIKEPVLVIAYLLNAANYDAYNVEASITLPPELHLVKGHLNHTIPVLKKGDQHQFPLLVSLKPSQKQSLPILFSVKSNTFPKNNISHSIHVTAPPKLELTTPDTVSFSEEDSYLILPAFVRNHTSTPITDINVSLNSLDSDFFSPFDRASKLIDTLPPYTTQALQWVIRTSALSTLSSLDIQATSPMALPTSTSLSFIKQSPPSSFLHIDSLSTATPPGYLTLRYTSSSARSMTLTYDSNAMQYISSATTPISGLSVLHNQETSSLSIQSTSDSDDFIYLYFHVFETPTTPFVLREGSSMIQSISYPVSNNHDIVNSN